MKALIVGLGSIAKKHIQVLRNINPEVELYALRSNNKISLDQNIKSIYSWNEVEKDTDFVIISNPTSNHYGTILEAIKHGFPLFIEKPPLANIDGANELVEEIRNRNIFTYTAFNLRFHPVIVWLKQHIAAKRIIEVQSYCGSYLPDWRQGSDYRNIYSSKKSQGGGVHLDLIHELDYIHYLFGLPLAINSFKSKKSDLEIDSYDCAHYWLEYENMNISVVLNYYRRDPKRTIEIVCEDETLYADLITWKISNSNGNVLFEEEPNILITYEAQMNYFIDFLSSGKKPMNSLEESIKTLRLCLQ